MYPPGAITRHRPRGAGFLGTPEDSGASMLAGAEVRIVELLKEIKPNRDKQGSTKRTSLQSLPAGISKKLSHYCQMLEQNPTNKGTLLRGTKMEPREDATPTLAEQGLDKKISSRSKRRNIADIDRIGLARHREEIVKKQAKANQKAGGNSKEVGRAKLPNPVNTRSILAAKAVGVSGGKIILDFP